MHDEVDEISMSRDSRMCTGSRSRQLTVMCWMWWAKLCLGYSDSLDLSPFYTLHHRRVDAYLCTFPQWNMKMIFFLATLHALMSSSLLVNRLKWEVNTNFSYQEQANHVDSIVRLIATFSDKIKLIFADSSCNSGNKQFNSAFYRRRRRKGCPE